MKREAWIIITPQKKFELDSIRKTRKECIYDYVHECCYMFRGDVLEHWKLAFGNYKCVKVEIKVK